MELTSGRSSEDTLRDYFSKYGEVVEALILSDEDRERGDRRGSGYVTFTDPARIRDALNQKHSILGTEVDVKPALCIFSETSLNQNNKKIYVGGLPHDLTKLELKNYFERFGTVTDAVVINEWKSHAYGFVTFDSEDVAHDVLQKSDLMMENRLLKVGRSRPASKFKDRNQMLILYNNDCNNTRLGSGRSDSETCYGPYPPQPPYAAYYPHQPPYPYYPQPPYAYYIPY